jgi:CheY-like chemotaxis protein
MISLNDDAADESTLRLTRARSILLVDDEPTLRSALRRFFTRRGWVVSEAEDGVRARTMLLERHASGSGFDAVITDMRMPNLSGIALHDEIAAIDATLARRFIFSSGDMGDEEMQAFIARTQRPVIAKPFELSVLLALAESVAASGDNTSS